jgi:hypothetical protein
MKEIKSMQTKRYTYGITIFTTPEMYQQIKKESNDLNISLAELVREMVREYFEHKRNNEEADCCERGSQNNAGC